MHYTKSIRTFEDDVTSSEHALVIQGGSLGRFGLVEWLYLIWRMFCILWAVTVFWSEFFRLLFLRVDCECNRHSFLATVIYGASAFNGDLNQWDVANVASMLYSKSIRILENDLTWHELMLLWLEGSVGGLSWWWWCDIKMVERWKNGGDWVYSPMVHCNNYVVWQTVIFVWDVLMIFHTFWLWWDFHVRFHAFRPLYLTQLFLNSWGLGVGGEEVLQRHAWERALGRKGRRTGVGWEYVEKGQEFAFFAGHGVLIRVLTPSFLALTVKELCLLFWSKSHVTSWFVLHIFRMRFPNGIFMYLFDPLSDFLMRLHAFGCIIVTRVLPPFFLACRLWMKSTFFSSDSVLCGFES